MGSLCSLRFYAYHDRSEFEVLFCPFITRLTQACKVCCKFTAATAHFATRCHAFLQQACSWSTFKLLRPRNVSQAFVKCNGRPEKLQQAAKEVVHFPQSLRLQVIPRPHPQVLTSSTPHAVACFFQMSRARMRSELCIMPSPREVLSSAIIVERFAPGRSHWGRGCFWSTCGRSNAVLLTTSKPPVRVAIAEN